MDTPLLIFLHGPGQSPPAWQDVVGAINPEQPMVAPWLKGLKPTEHGGFDMDQAVEAVADVMEVRGAAKADLVGYSLGGLVALKTAISYPEKVAHLVLISTPVILSPKTIARQRMMVKIAPSMLFKEVSKEHVLAALDALAAADLDVDYARVTTPVLAIAAEGDAMGRAGLDLLSHDAHAVTRYLPGTDPDLLKTAPAKLAQLISDFCADFLDSTESAL